MRYLSIFAVFSMLACSVSSLPPAEDCLALCEQGALCSGNDGTSCETTCARWEDATERYTCEPQYQDVLDCASENLA